MENLRTRRPRWRRVRGEATVSSYTDPILGQLSPPATGHGQKKPNLEVPGAKEQKPGQTVDLRHVERVPRSATRASAPHHEQYRSPFGRGVRPAAKWRRNAARLP